MGPHRAWECACEGSRRIGNSFLAPGCCAVKERARADTRNVALPLGWGHEEAVSEAGLRGCREPGSPEEGQRCQGVLDARISSGTPVSGSPELQRWGGYSKGELGSVGSAPGQAGSGGSRWLCGHLSCCTLSSQGFLAISPGAGRCVAEPETVMEH